MDAWIDVLELTKKEDGERDKKTIRALWQVGTPLLILLVAAKLKVFLYNCISSR